MRKIFLTILLILPLGLVAQSADTSTDNGEDQAVAVLTELEHLADSIEKTDYRQPAAEVKVEQSELDRRLLEWSLNWLDTTLCDMQRDTTDTPDSVYIKRLRALPTDIAMPFNHVVKTFIEMYVKRRPRQVAALLRVSEYYFPIFENKLGQYGLPYELKYLPVIESALNASARSRVGAAGLWQFMPATARLYGLEVNSLVDERLDPYKSTDAACRMLKSMYNVFGDWHMVLAAYNCGPGNVNKAIRRSGKHDFWGIYNYLPRETRSYVPIFIAANYAMTYADDHGICPDTLHVGHRLKQHDKMMPMLTDTIHTDRRQSLEQTAAVLGLPIAELRRLNPEYLKDIIPGGKSYTLVLPIDYADDYIHYEDTIVAYKADSLIGNQQAVEVASQEMQSPRSKSTATYVVKKGDTLGAIARRYHCSVAQLQKWNNLKGTSIRAGQKLKLHK